MIEFLQVVRDPDEYEKTHLGMEDVSMGYYAHGHHDKAKFLHLLLEKVPGLLIDYRHWGWHGRWIASQKGGKWQFPDWKPHPPTVSDVYHVYWREHKENFRRARPGSRGSYAVTYLPIEAQSTIDQLNDVYGKDWS